MKNTEAEAKVDGFIEKLVFDHKNNSKVIMAKLTDFFMEIVPEEVKAQVYKDIEEVFEAEEKDV